MSDNLPHAIYRWKGLFNAFPMIYRMRQVSTRNESQFLILCAIYENTDMCFHLK